MSSLSSLNFILVQKAKSKGGDKYVNVSDPTFSIYVPQSMSRVDDNSYPKLKLVANDSNSGSNLEFVMVQKAKSKGGDKYANVKDPSFTIYFPQSISRKEDEVSMKLYYSILPDLD